MTPKELLDIMDEIQKIKLELYGRVIKTPKGTGRCEPGTRGRCVVCDKEYEASETIRRCCKDRMIVKRDGTKMIAVVGYRVCYHCSPWTYDWQLELYSQDCLAWPEHIKRHEDTGVFDHTRTDNLSVMPGKDRLAELNHYFEDDELAYLDTRIKVLEGKLDV